MIENKSTQIITVVIISHKCCYYSTDDSGYNCYCCYKNNNINNWLNGTRSQQRMELDLPWIGVYDTQAVGGPQLN